MAVLLFASGQLWAQKNHEYVDLGLPSGTLWATCNVGATTPDGYGDYFAWGDVDSKSSTDWGCYKYGKGKNNQLTKYCINPSYGFNGFSDKLMVLQAGDDAATANWGKEWCTPTKEQWEELYQTTTRSWSSKNGVNGVLFTGSNGKSIFLPAAGCLWGNDLGATGVLGSYWSSTVDRLLSNLAWSFFFNCNSGGSYIDGGNRADGQCVRPVRSGK